MALLSVTIAVVSTDLFSQSLYPHSPVPILTQFQQMTVMSARPVLNQTMANSATSVVSRTTCYAPAVITHHQTLPAPVPIVAAAVAETLR